MASRNPLARSIATDEPAVPVSSDGRLAVGRLSQPFANAAALRDESDRES